MQSSQSLGPLGESYGWHSNSTATHNAARAIRSGKALRSCFLLWHGLADAGDRFCWVCSQLLHRWNVAPPLPSPVVHVHAIVFSLWILVLIAQTGLATAGQVRIHRRFGIAGFILALLLPVVGLWAATEMLARRMPGPDPLGVYLVATTNVVAFGVLILFVFRARF